MRLTACYYVGPRDRDGSWEIEASLLTSERSIPHSDMIDRGLSSDWIRLTPSIRTEFLESLLSGRYVAPVGKHPWDGGNEWYITPLKEGVVVEHQWLQEYQRDGVGWYTWDLVRAVVVLTQWCDAMRKNEAALDVATLHSARLMIEVKNWKPAQSLASLGWKSSEDG
jgi:hypothetical protein